MLNILLLIAGTILVFLHAPLLGLFFVYLNVEDFCLAVLFLASGMVLIWLSRRLSASVVKKELPEFRYGATYLGGIFSGLSLLDVIAIYLFTIMVTAVVCFIEGKINAISEVFAGVYFILTVIFCITYPIFYHPYISWTREVVSVIKSIKAELKVVRSISYARSAGLLIRLDDSTITVIRSPPFGTSPLILASLLGRFLEHGEELTQLLIVATFKKAKEYFSKPSLADWPIPPRVFKTFEKNYVEMELDGELVMGVKTRVILDIPHPEKRLRRLQGEALVIYTDLKRKILKRMDKSAKYSAMILRKIIPMMVNYLRE